MTNAPLVVPPEHQTVVWSVEQEISYVRPAVALYALTVASPQPPGRPVSKYARKTFSANPQDVFSFAATFGSQARSPGGTGVGEGAGGTVEVDVVVIVAVLVVVIGGGNTVSVPLLDELRV